MHPALAAQAQDSGPRPIGSANEAAQLVTRLAATMDALLPLIEQETELVRAGRLRDAAQLEPAKSALARDYVADTMRVKAGQNFVARIAPEALDALRRRHDLFKARLQMNVTVLATAHAVSESIMRGVSEELSRKAAPQTYGATGRHTAPRRGAAQPLTVSRTL